jgi:hypothetical protein
VTVDSGWARRNLGIEYATGAARDEAGAPDEDRAIQRELIDFDSEGPQLSAFAATAQPALTGLSHFVDIKWPDGLAPKPGDRPTGESCPIPRSTRRA